MKELLLPAVLDARHCDATPSDLCQWLLSLTGGMATEAHTDASTDALADVPMLYHTPRPGVLEVWLKDTSLPPSADVLSYQRVSFCPLPLESASGPDASLHWRIRMELLPAGQVYTRSPLSEMGMLGTSPSLVVIDGRVAAYKALTPPQIARLGHMYAVLTPALSARLGLPPAVRRKTPAASSPYEALQQDAEQLLARCFPAGGTVEDCPLRLSLRLADVPDERLRYVGAEHRLLRFGGSGEGREARIGFSLHGACLPAKCCSLSFTMLYPRGQLDAACRLFSLFSPLASLIAVIPVANVDEWVPYDADERASRELTQALYTRPVTDVPADARVYCLLTPPVGADHPWAGRELLVRLRQQVLFLGSLFLGPVPLHAVTPEVFSWYLPTLASRLLVQAGGVPWVPRCFASQHTDLIAGISHSRPGQSLEAFGAATFFNDPLLGCRFSFCKPLAKFTDFFSWRFRLAYENFRAAHCDRPPERLVIYCHHDLPTESLLPFVRWMASFPEALPVVLVLVRRTTDTMLRHYAPDAPGCMPPAGTLLHCGDDSFLLFCRDFVPSFGSRGPLYPYPLEVSLKRLSADGALLPPLPAEVDGLLVQVCQLVWAHPEGLDGSPLPLVLSHTDRLVRHRCQEWQVEMSDDSATF